MGWPERAGQSMRIVRVASLGVVAILVARSLNAQVVFLQNDSFASGPVSCNTGIGMYAGLSAKFTAAPGQYPYTITAFASSAAAAARTRMECRSTRTTAAPLPDR